jgi:AhpD family alkylhydroperoxidase
MTDIELVTAEQAPLLARRYYAGGWPGPITAALAHVPEVLEVALPFIDTILGPTSLDLRTKELVILRTSARLGCDYCTKSHTVAARDAGLTVEQVRALRGELPVEAALTDPGELALLDWVDAVALGPGPVPAAARAAMRARVGDPALVELTLLVGAVVMLNRFCTALELPVGRGVLARLDTEGFGEGLA